MGMLGTKKANDIDAEIDQHARDSEKARDELYSSRSSITPDEPKKVKGGYEMSETGIEFLKGKEELRTEAYEDSKKVWTIGYGHTKNVKPGMRISVEEADQIFKKDLSKSINAVRKSVKVPLNQNQFDALVMFDFNTGALPGSTLVKKLNAGDYDTAFNVELPKWHLITKNGEKVPLPGLVNRREFERNLANTPIKPKKI